MNFYPFGQANSGGYFYTRGDIGHLVIIEGRTANSANNRAEREGLFDVPYCSCCGRRFRRTDESYAEVSIEKILRYNHAPGDVIWVWRTNGDKYQVDRQGNKI